MFAIEHRRQHAVQANQVGVLQVAVAAALLELEEGHAVDRADLVVLRETLVDLGHGVGEARSDVSRSFGSKSSG